MANISKPNKNEVEKYLKKWDEKGKTVLHEQALNKLFKETYPNNNDMSEVLVKASTLNQLYSTNIFSIVSMAQHILELNTDERLKKADLSLVKDIADVNISGTKKKFYSFATKYCSHHNPNEFPIYDRYVEKCLMYFKRKYGFADFVKQDLKDYEKFKEILLSFKAFFHLEEFNLKQIDMYLWQLGKDKFPNKH